MKIRPNGTARPHTGIYLNYRADTRLLQSHSRPNGLFSGQTGREGNASIEKEWQPYYTKLRYLSEIHRREERGGAHMEYVIGIDGGGTKTVLAAADLAGRILCRAEGGGTNLNALGIDAVHRTIDGMSRQVQTRLGVSAAECRSLCIGAAGADRPAEQASLREIFRSAGYRCPMTITNDGITALWQGTPDGVGVVAESGTGSICYGRRADGATARAGGWGHILGDEGSAYDIAVRALRAVTRSADGRAGPTALAALIQKELGIGRPEDLIAWAYRSHTGKREIARLAKLVDAAAEKDDPAAAEILEKAGWELALCAGTVARRLGFDGPFPLVLAGGVLLHSRPVADAFRRHIRSRYPQSRFCPLEGHDTAMGAVRIARNQGGFSTSIGKGKGTV